jgi:hypothetical protein
MKWKNALVGILYLLALSTVSPKLMIDFANGTIKPLHGYFGRRKLPL